MLTEDKNQLLTRVGPGTAMGNLLRRYWHPIAAVVDLDREPVVPVRLLGEDLVLYRDRGGRYGLLDRHCAHRRADLAYGYIEDTGLRCHYHGWCYDAHGRCIDQPFEEKVDPAARLKASVRITAYRVQAKAGLLWAYLGPLPEPELPDWELFSWPNGFRQIVFADIPCNWLQCQENSIDPVHFEWTHSNWSVRLAGKDGPYVPTHLKLDFVEHDYGFSYRRVRTDTDERDPLWTIGRICLWPNGFFLGQHFEWRVPVDDENTLSVVWSFIRVPKEAEPYVQESIPAWRSPTTDPTTGKWITSHVVNQDIVAWAGQGRIADRTREHLGASDRGIGLLRRRLFNDLDAVAAGRDPSAIRRDPASNVRVELPMIDRELHWNGMTLEEYRAHPFYGTLLRDFRWHCGQPPAVRAAFAKAMGIAP
jgi:5,5'-dehydrodivanillate O-demethylase